jgi:hypothetical protein
MEQWKYDFIEQVTSSKQFRARSNGGVDHKLLIYLAEHSTREDRDARSGILLQHRFRLKTGSSNFIRRLITQLHRYFKSREGRQHPWRIEILYGNKIHPDDHYRVLFTINKHALRRIFWRPYLEQKYPTFIAYGLPLFEKSTDQTEFKRVFNVNDEDKARSEGWEGQICWPFVAAGDLLAAFSCNRFLSEQQVSVDFKAFKATEGMTELQKATDLHSNVIAVGSVRVNGVLDLYQCHELKKAARRYLPFRLSLDDVTEVDDDEQTVDPPHKEIQRRDWSSVPVVITRRVGVRHNRNAVTLIASNHGRAVARAAELLTSEDELQELFEDSRLQPWLANMPANFQILLRVKVPVREETAAGWDLVDVWG